MHQIDYSRYLAAKRSVDDRSINERVLSCFEEALQCADQSNILRIVELGAGTGSMLHRFLRRNMLVGWPRFKYTLVDIKSYLLEEAKHDIASLALTESGVRKLPSPEEMDHTRERQYDCTSKSEHLHFGQSCGPQVSDISKLSLWKGEVFFVVEDAIDHLKKNEGCYDVVVAAAFMDLMDFGRILPAISRTMDKKQNVALFYAPINFDGVTDFRPSSSEGVEFDRWVVKEFHTEMSKISGGATIDQCASGRRLLSSLQDSDMNIISSGSSSWIVHPSSDNKYSNDEAYFLHCIISFIEEALSGRYPKDSPETSRISRYVVAAFSCRS